MTNLFLFTKESEEKKPSNSFSNFASIIDRRNIEPAKKKKTLSNPHQFFGLWIAENLGEFDNLSLYIRLAKHQDKNLLTQAVSYIKDYPDAKSKHKLFMWYLKGKLKKVQNTKIKIKKAKGLF